MTAAYDDNNVFARIIRGELPSHKVFEDDRTLAFLDIHPMTTGHTLVLPKARARNILDIDDAALSALIVKVARIARAAQRAFASEGVTVQQHNEEPAGQSVFHLHFHVLPRWAGVRLQPQTGPMESPEVLAGWAAKLRDALR